MKDRFDMVAASMEPNQETVCNMLNTYFVTEAKSPARVKLVPFPMLPKWHPVPVIESWVERWVNEGRELPYEVNIFTMQEQDTGDDYLRLVLHGDDSPDSLPLYDRVFLVGPHFVAASADIQVTPITLDEGTEKLLIKLLGVDAGHDTDYPFSENTEGTEPFFSRMFNADVWRVEYMENGDFVNVPKWEKSTSGWNPAIAGALLNVFRSRGTGNGEATIHFYHCEHSPDENDGEWAIEIRSIEKGPQNFSSLWLHGYATLHRVNSSVVARLPDAEMRSVAEPAYLMSAKAVRDAWGNAVLEKWHYDAIVNWGLENGWKEVQKYGRQLLFIANLRLL